MHVSIVSTIPEKCRRCYACVRECPAKAIKVIAGQATVIAEQCVACGNCVKVCTQKAKRIEDATMLVSRMLSPGYVGTSFLVRIPIDRKSTEETNEHGKNGSAG